MSIFYVNGDYLPEADARLSVRDLAVLRGYGAFDFMRTYGGQPFRLRDNIKRLRHSCSLIELDVPWSDDDIAAIVRETLARNQGTAEEFNIRLVVTGGISSSNILPDGEPSLLVLVQPLQPNPAAWYENGVKVITVDSERLYPASKTIIYTPAIIAQKRAKAQGGVEALYKDANDHVLEGTTTNLFAFFDGTLVTPSLESGILSGITRMTVLELAEDAFPLDIRPLPYADLLKADEVFISAANKRIVPVIDIDGHTIGDGQPGQHTRRMMALFDERTMQTVAEDG